MGCAARKAAHRKVDECCPPTPVSGQFVTLHFDTIEAFWPSGAISVLVSVKRPADGADPDARVFFSEPARFESYAALREDLQRALVPMLGDDHAWRLLVVRRTKKTTKTTPVHYRVETEETYQHWAAKFRGSYDQAKARRTAAGQLPNGPAPTSGSGERLVLVPDSIPGGAA